MPIVPQWSTLQNKATVEAWAGQHSRPQICGKHDILPLLTIIVLPNINK